MIHRGCRFKLAPTPEQQMLFRQFSGVCRLVYNVALEQRRDWHRHYQRQTGDKLNYIAQARELTALRADLEWVRAVYVSCQQQVLRDLDGACGAFFAERARYPTPRRKGVNDGFRFPGREVAVRKLNAKWSSVRLPKIGWVKFRDTRQLGGRVLSATVSRDALGWHVSFACEVEHVGPSSLVTSVGIDRGVAVTLALSTGEMLRLPPSLAALDRRHRAAQRVLARRRKRSNRRRRQAARCARLSAKRARIRRDFHHKAALDIARRFGSVVMEDLNVRGMTASAKGTIVEPGTNVRQKAGLNRSILNAGWSDFARILAYKLEERGGSLSLVPAAYTSQTCSACDVVDARSRESQARFRCVACGHTENADVNAAKTIWRRNTACQDVEGPHRRPDEASTSTTEGRGNPRPSGRGRC